MTRVSKQDQEHAREVLLEALHPHDTVYCILRHVSRSGMMRHISLVVMRDGEPWDISYFAHCVLGWSMDDHDGSIKCSGCGMDMGFHLVYSLARRLWPDGWTVTREQYYHNGHMPPGSHMSDGGYALSQRWI